MAALIKGFRTFVPPPPPPELLANAAANERVPWYRRGGMGLFEHAAIVTEFVPALVLQYQLLYCGASLPQCAVAAVMTFAALHKGITTGDGSVVASILMPLYWLTIGSGALLPRPLVSIVAAFLLAGVKLGVCMSAVLHRWAGHAAFACSYPMAIILAILGCLATQGGPVWWGSKHRVHHAYCDRARDPHSPRLLGLIGAFAWFGKVCGRRSLSARQRLSQRTTHQRAARAPRAASAACLARPLMLPPYHHHQALKPLPYISTFTPLPPLPPPSVHGYVFGQEDKFVDLAHVPPHLEGALLLLIDTYSFVPTLLELLLAYHYGGTTGLYISYVGGALCKAGSLWFNVTNHPPEQPTDSRGCAAVDDVDKGKLEPPNIFFALVQVSRSPPPAGQLTPWALCCPNPACHLGASLCVRSSPCACWHLWLTNRPLRAVLRRSARGPTHSSSARLSTTTTTSSPRSLTAPEASTCRTFASSYHWKSSGSSGTSNICRPTSAGKRVLARAGANASERDNE